MPFIDKSEAMARFDDLARFHRLSKPEQDRYMKEFDDDVVLNDVFVIKYQEGEKSGIKKGLRKGRAEGRAEALVTIARRMKQKGDSVATIAEITGLSEEEIEKL